MAGILNEYLDKRLSFTGLQQELERLVKEYNSYTGRYLLIYASDFNKAKQGVPDISMDQDDFYNIQDILRESTESRIDVYIETPGGSGEAAEEIARFLHKKFEEVNFVIASESKSAGTILVLSGDNIYMTETGSLGPIDAQTRIGRSIQSAYDYKEWIEQKREEALRNKYLNPVDAQIIAQITPGELSGIVNALEFAKDLVSNWLVQYKFKNWTKRVSSGAIVTDEYKRARAKEVADKLCNHGLWRSHGRSIKIEDLKEIILIERVEDDANLADIVYRIKIVLKLLFGSSTIYKIYRTADTLLSKTAVMAMNDSKGMKIPLPQPKEQKEVRGAEIQIRCSKCGKQHTVNAYFQISSEEAKKMGLLFNPNIDERNNLICDNCGFLTDLNPVMNQLEQKEKSKVIIR